MHIFVKKVEALTGFRTLFSDQPVTMSPYIYWSRMAQPPFRYSVVKTVKVIYWPRSQIDFQLHGQLNAITCRERSPHSSLSRPTRFSCPLHSCFHLTTPDCLRLFFIKHSRIHQRLCRLDALTIFHSL